MKHTYIVEIESSAPNTDTLDYEVARGMVSGFFPANVRVTRLKEGKQVGVRALAGGKVLEVAELTS